MKPNALAIATMALLFASAASGEADLPVYETRYYTIHTDLGADDVREATIRMTRMAEEYYKRTKDFSGEINQRMPFYLFKNAEDYYAGGAPRTTAGYFNGTELVAMADNLGPQTWNTVQHEGFHQFAHFMIRGELPPWVNEGLAEYFGEALFTGDKFVIGVIPQWRLKRIRKTLSEGGFRPLDEMMNLTHAQWNSELAIINYDQGWSMVQFLAHGKNGKYQHDFGRFLGELGRGARWQESWQRIFGDIDLFDRKWHEYWANLPDNPTIELYVQANIATLSGFYARAVSQHQTFRNFDAFIQAAQEKKLKPHPDDWLPPSLLERAVKQAEDLTKAGFSYALVVRTGDRPQLACSMPDGRRVIGRFLLDAKGRVTSVTADLVPRKPAGTAR